MKNLVYLYILFFLITPAFAQETVEQIPEESTEERTWRNTLSDGLRALNINILDDYLNDYPAGTVATVNNTPINLQEVENLFDMLSPSYSVENYSLEGVLDEYSVYLIELIKQELIRQELNRREIIVDYSEAQIIEATIRASYGDASFEEEGLEGIDLESWRGQLYARIEQEHLQDFLAQQVRIDSENVLEYYETHQNRFVIPERYTLVMFSSTSEEEIQNAHSAQVISAEQAEDFDITLQEGSFSLQNIPTEWQEEVQLLENNELSEIKNYENAYRYVVLINKTDEHIEDETTIFLQIEQTLRDEQTQIIYNTWLNSAMQEAEIFIAEDFLQRIYNQY